MQFLGVQDNVIPFDKFQTAQNWRNGNENEEVKFDNHGERIRLEDCKDEISELPVSRKRKTSLPGGKSSIKIFSLRKYTLSGKRRYLQMILMLSYIAKMREAKSFFSQRELYYAMRGAGCPTSCLLSMPSYIYSSSSSVDSSFCFLCFPHYV